MIVSGQTKYIAELHWCDPDGELHVERHAGLDIQTPTTWAYRRAVSMLIAGQAVSWTTRHFEQRYA